MTFKRTLVVTLCLLIFCCSSEAERGFDKIVFKLDKYFSKKPTLLTSDKIIKSNKEIYIYYTLKIIDYQFSHNFRKTFSSRSHYDAFIKISCNAVENSKSGDAVSDASEFAIESVKDHSLARGFSTTDLALINTNYSKEMRFLTFTIRYSYQNNKWVYRDIVVGGASDFLIDDLQSFRQNQEFREVIGMKSK